MTLDEKTKQELVEFFLTQPCSRVTPSGREISMRCPICGDSNKSRTETNFSINIESNDNKPMLYQCFRAACGARGRVDQEFLMMLGFGKHYVIRELNRFNRKISKSGKKFKSFKHKELVNFVNTTNETNIAKLKYINNRLGLNLTLKDIYNLKINFSLNDLLKINEINIPDKKKYYYNQLSDYGVSFISSYNDYVIIRDISKSGKLKRRYSNINIFDNYDNVKKFYTIPTKIDVLSNEPIVLNVSEGAMDILGVYYNLDIDKKYKNHIYAAASGSGLNNLIFHFIRQYGLIDIKINVFSDDDVNKDAYKLLYKLKPYIINFDINIFYNTLSKDFGVKKNEIKYIMSKL